MDYDSDLVRHILGKLDQPPGQRSWANLIARGYDPVELTAHLAMLDTDGFVTVPNKTPTLRSDPARSNLTTRGKKRIEAINERRRFYDKLERLNHNAKNMT